ncbi:hypothetical protein KHA94_09780 [Bacillus sp. FJAT-49705]|uniref:Transposase n=1 Tax=Cytobacillus citreus TaxID=2833586 RepID=A0ABS5NRP3_9BACI|nr:hypothetical protein [Cytobacillus citreus]MBS4190479.1 hypothetical protein [Cytobacillus citreus]
MPRLAKYNEQNETFGDRNRNRQVYWNTVFVEMKAKAKTALECDEKATIYAQRKVGGKCVRSHQG